MNKKKQVGDLVTSFLERFDEEETHYRDKPITGLLIKKQPEGGTGILCSVLVDGEIQLFMDDELVETPLTIQQLDGVRGGMSQTIFDLWRSEFLNEDR